MSSRRWRRQYTLWDPVSSGYFTFDWYLYRVPATRHSMLRCPPHGVSTLPLSSASVVLHYRRHVDWWRRRHSRFSPASCEYFQLVPLWITIMSPDLSEDGPFRARQCGGETCVWLHFIYDNLDNIHVSGGIWSDIQFCMICQSIQQRWVPDKFLVRVTVFWSQ